MRKHVFKLRLTTGDEVGTRVLQDMVLEAISKDEKLNKLVDNKHTRLTVSRRTKQGDQDGD